MQLSPIGEIAAQCWMENPQHHPYMELDEWIDPDPVGIENQMSAISPKTGSLSVAVRSFKSAVTRLAHEAGHEFGWQDRFWDRIIRNEAELDRIRKYIRANPSNWEGDRNNHGVLM